MMRLLARQEWRGGRGIQGIRKVASVRIGGLFY